MSQWGKNEKKKGLGSIRARRRLTNTSRQCFLVFEMWELREA